MARLVECKVCQGKVSSDARCCPHCGSPFFIDQRVKEDIIREEKQAAAQKKAEESHQRASIEADKDYQEIVDKIEQNGFCQTNMLNTYAVEKVLNTGKYACVTFEKVPRIKDGRNGQIAMIYFDDERVFSSDYDVTDERNRYVYYYYLVKMGSHKVHLRCVSANRDSRPYYFDIDKKMCAIRFDVNNESIFAKWNFVLSIRSVETPSIEYSENWGCWPKDYLIL